MTRDRMTTPRVTDTDFLAHVLADGEWHSQMDVVLRSQRERGCGMTVHSRAADLRKRGLTVEQRSRRTGNGRVASFYRLVQGEALEAPVVEVGAGSAAGSPQATGASSVGPAGDGEGPVPTLDSSQLVLDVPTRRELF